MSVTQIDLDDGDVMPHRRRAHKKEAVNLAMRVTSSGFGASKAPGPLARVGERLGLQGWVAARDDEKALGI